MFFFLISLLRFISKANATCSNKQTVFSNKLCGSRSIGSNSCSRNFLLLYLHICFRYVAHFSMFFLTVSALRSYIVGAL
ncbi:hypothetical protein ABFX02_05G134200 [Erythranthe guttata]